MEARRETVIKAPVSGTVTFPVSDDDCANNGWRAFPQFTEEAECRAYVASLAP